MAAPVKKKPEKRRFRLGDAVEKDGGGFVFFGLSPRIDEDTLAAKLKSKEWVEVDAAGNDLESSK